MMWMLSGAHRDNHGPSGIRSTTLLLLAGELGLQALWLEGKLF